MPVHKKKRLFEMGRQATHTKIGAKRVRAIKGRGGNRKFRALRMDHGNFSWGSEQVTRKTKVLKVEYNATNNELQRTQTLVKNGIVSVDATPFKEWYKKHYGVEIGKKKKTDEDATKEPEKQSKHLLAKIKGRCKDRKLEDKLASAFVSGRLLACISSRPGQSGRVDGYILEGKELEFYIRKTDKKKKQ